MLLNNDRVLSLIELTDSAVAIKLQQTAPPALQPLAIGGLLPFGLKTNSQTRKRVVPQLRFINRNVNAVASIPAVLQKFACGPADTYPNGTIRNPG